MTTSHEQMFRVLGRWRLLDIANGKVKTKYVNTYSDFEGEPTPENLGKWLFSLDPSKDWTVCQRDYDCEFYAVYTTETPYSEEEVVAAQKWVDENPDKIKGRTVSFRPLTPFNVNAVDKEGRSP